MSQAQTVLAAAVAAGATVRDGADPSGSVTVTLDDAGHAHDILVAPDWRRRLAGDDAATVGAAVVAADHDAAQRRAQATAIALGQSSSTPPPAHDSLVDSPLWPAGIEPVQPATGPRRSLSELTAAVWAAFDELDGVTAPPAPVQVSAAEGAVRLSLSDGRITACSVDPAWLARQDETTLAQALRQALSHAARQARQAQAPLRDYSSRLDDLLAEVMAHLGPTERGGGDDTAHGR